jgi:hypothetical protein
MLQTSDSKCTCTHTHTLHGPLEREEKAAEKATLNEDKILKKNQSKRIYLKIVNKYTSCFLIKTKVIGSSNSTFLFLLFFHSSIMHSTISATRKLD